MKEELTIETERVDDVPVLLAQLDKMQVARLLDEHFPRHGNWQGLSVGITSVVWLSHILSQANHRLNHVQPWAQQRLATLQSSLEQPVRALDCSDDRLACILDKMIGLRVLTLLEFTVRQQLVAQQGPLVGLYAGQPKRATAHPTAEKLLSAFEGLTLTRITQAGQLHAHMTPLSSLQQRILALLGFPPDLFSRVAVNSSELALQMSEP